MPEMRAKMRISHIENFGSQEKLHLSAVCAPGYPSDGSDENNTFAAFTPSAELSITISNPALLGKFSPDETYYLDFTKAEA